MDNKDILKSIYDDFFGTNNLKKENEKLAKELKKMEDFPKIELNKEIVATDKKEEYTEEENKELVEKKIVDFFERIDNLYITQESKNMLKKIIEYIKRYNENIEKKYIPFNMCIYSDNDENIYEIIEIIDSIANYFSYVKKGEIVEASLYDVEEVEQVEKQIYTKENNVIVLKNLEGLVAKEQYFKDRFWNKVESKIDEEKYLTIIVSKNKELVNQVFTNNENIKQKFFDFEIISTKPDVQDVYQDVIEKLNENSNVSDEVSVKLLDYITITYPASEMSYPEYRDKLVDNILFKKQDEITENDIPEYRKDKSIDEIFAELNGLVGLEKVKKALQDLVSLNELKSKTEGQLNIKNTNLHMVFLGNPGTGKTTVARIVAQILYNLKYIKQDKLIEVSSKDLVAEYVGQTAPKTMAVVEKAMGGVLFIDEAYSLASGSGQGNSFNEEAVATLIQAMENYRDNLVVIFAGYTKEMQDFLNLNSGIVSRIGYTLDFEDYTEDQLVQIFNSMMNKSGFDVNDDAIDVLRDIIKEYKNSDNFGNARFIRNVYEKSIIKHATNTKGKKMKKILKTITKDDISVENLIK